MDARTIAALVEYFDLKAFFANNSPLRLAIILGIMAILWLIAHFLCNYVQYKLEKLVLAKGASAGESKTAAVQPVSRIDVGLFEKVVKNVRRLLYLAILYWGLSHIIIGPNYAEAIRVLFIALCIWAGIKFLTAFVPFNIDLYLRRDGGTLKTSKSRSLMPIVNGLIWAIGLTFLLDNLGFHVSTIIAGLGIVGVAVGMAGQAILADFFSYLVILLDKPFGIGDYVELGEGKAGEVEYMGPKTTHLRSLQDDLIVCANSEMTKGVLVNLGSIREREVLVSFGVAYETPVPILKKMPDIIREVVESFPKCRFDRVCLLNFGNSNLQYQLLYFVSDTKNDIRAFMNIRSNVNIAILERFNKENISMAYPTEHVLFTDLSKPTPASATNQAA